MSNWERRPLRKSQQHYGALDAYIMIPIIKFLIAKAEEDGLPPFKKFVKTLDNTKILLNGENYDSDDFDEERAYSSKTEKIVVQSNGNHRNKK
jgi:ribonuclease D